MIPSELSIPPAARADRASVEILRVWLTADGQEVILRHDVWDDAAAWGLMLADIARHVANAYAQSAGGDVTEVLERIRAGLEAEFGSPTDEASGEVDLH